MGSQMLMMLIALPGEYVSLLAKHNIVIPNHSSWEPIVFPPDTTQDHAAFLLAQAGLSVNEVSDASHFTLVWCVMNPNIYISLFNFHYGFIRLFPSGLF